MAKNNKPAGPGKTADELLTLLQNKGTGNDKKAAATEVATALGADTTKKEDVSKACDEAKKTLTDAKDAAEKKTSKDDKAKIKEFEGALAKIENTNNELGQPKPKNADKKGAETSAEEPAKKEPEEEEEVRLKQGNKHGDLYSAMLAALPNGSTAIMDFKDKVKKTYKNWKDEQKREEKEVDTKVTSVDKPELKKGADAQPTPNVPGAQANVATATTDATNTLKPKPAADVPAGPITPTLSGPNNND